MNLLNQTVFITDADHPSGRALIARFAREGVPLALNSPSGGNAIREELAALTEAKVKLLQLDLRSRAAIVDALEAVEEELGPVGLLIHNQHRYEVTNLEHCSESLFVDVMDTNAKSAFLCTQIIGGRMAERGFGSILYVTSIHAEKPAAASFIYSASQGAIQMLAAEAALELGRRGVRVNTVEIAPVSGEEDHLTSPLSTLYDNYARKAPLQTVKARDLAELALFLSGDEAGALHGATIRLDGGFLLHYMDHKMKKST
ncbi:SDR family NAD(P)-dependent oxidoreductase [Paenibacillus daejeonensis]|uniref:SDR family NAD(P)-dependent oxidoreductase n=1 Tax=Paenibacillus daejeonensis TaxID=135193 RepID=UPI00035C6C91|nr:SDR family oxidoreductase [Paenibacillus daejeonensis]